MNGQALLELLVDSFWKILIPGLKMGLDINVTSNLHAFIFDEKNNIV